MIDLRPLHLGDVLHVVAGVSAEFVGLARRAAQRLGSGVWECDLPALRSSVSVLRPKVIVVSSVVLELDRAEYQDLARSVGATLFPLLGEALEEADLQAMFAVCIALAEGRLR